MKQMMKTIPAVAVAAMLAACGGGGGSGGTTSAEYQITLRADKVQLPINIDNQIPGLNGYSGTGVYSPYTTVLHVEATVGGAPIPGGKEIFGCNASAGLRDNALYYLDGADEHSVEVDINGEKVKIPGAYRSIVLPSNAGGASFHFHAGNEAEVAKITCSVTDPRDKMQKSASVEIRVGGATGKPASVRLNAAIPGYLGTQKNSQGLLNQMGLQALVLDDNNQPASTAGANVQVSILPGTAAADSGARLVSGSQSGSTIQLPSIGGVAQLSLLSGTETGTIFLQMVADRLDNNVSNGVQDPMLSIREVPVLEQLAAPLQFWDKDLGDITNGMYFSSFLEAQGGLPPLTWSATGLPKGLSIDSATGMISGTPDDAVDREYRAKVTVVDKNKQKAEATIKMKLLGSVKPEDFFINCLTATTGGLNDACVLPSAPVKDNYTYAFSASVPGVTWDISGLPSWLKAGTTAQLGTISGLPENADCGRHQFIVTAKKGQSSVTRTMSVRVVTNPAHASDDYRCP